MHKLVSTLQRNTLGVVVALALALAACTTQPHAESNLAPTIQHASLTGQPCEQCHDGPGNQPGRPGAAADGFPHGGNQDCAVCHIPSPNDTADMTQWNNRQPFNHTPKPQACEPCHATERPTPQADKAHPTTGDCAGCHDYPVFKAPGS